MLLTSLKHAPKAFETTYKPVFDGVAAGDKPTDFTRVAPTPASARLSAAGTDGADAATAAAVEAYKKKMSDKGTPVEHARAYRDVITGVASRV
jgi:hypothetical protein